MKVAYLDAFSGVAGDMFVGALLDCGLELGILERELAKLDLSGYRLRVEVRERSGIRATKFVVDIPKQGRHESHHHHDHAEPAHGHRAYRDIRQMVLRGGLAPRVSELALRTFGRLAEAEGKVHGVAPEDVEFHEVGAIDSIVDVVGAAWAVDALGIEEIAVSPLPLGQGVTTCTLHGPLPIPGPATIELLRGFPVRIGDGEGELVTPTGAAIVAALARPGAMPRDMVVERIGYGAGDRELQDRPNLLRVLVGTTPGETGADSLLLLEANLDDLNPELYEYVIERLFAAGARDVYLTAVQMKKGRPGTLVSVLCDLGKRDALASILFMETTTLGVRVSPVARLRVEREVVEVDTRFGRVRVKIGRAPDGTANVAPEYEDCKKLATSSGSPLKVIYQEAVAAALRV